MSISNFCKDMEDMENMKLSNNEQGRNEKNEENSADDSSELSDDENYNNKYESYPLSIITQWLKRKKIDYKYSQSNVLGMYLYQTGIEIKIKDEEISIQTHPMIAGWAFAETLIRSNMLSDTRHATPEDLFKFIESLL
jgi:hypothetical protein